MNLLLVSYVLMKSKARSTALASAVKVDVSSGLVCLIIWLPNITAPLSIPLAHQYKIVENSYNDFAAFLNHLLICEDLI